MNIRRAVILAHFDRDGILDEHVKVILASLSGPGTDVVLVSTNLRHPNTHADGLASIIIVRDNEGYDFRSWQVGVAALQELESYDEIVCLNDSFYLAREQALVDCLSALEMRKFDVGGLTASRENCFHLQSYLMVFRRRAVQSEWFKSFWQAVSVTSDRAAAIRNYELRLALQAHKAGLRVTTLLGAPVLPHLPLVKAWWSARPTDQSLVATARTLVDALDRSMQINPTLHTWELVARRCGIVKVELLRDNPRDADLSSLAKFMDAGCLALARQHLARVSQTSTTLVEDMT